MKLKLDGGPTYRDWLKQDVRWIMPDEEVAAFKKLQNDEERDQFVDLFWLRRDPTPETITNEFKQEHYRRMMYANEHFGAGVPGWETDRGRIYVIYGPPDRIASGESTAITSNGKEVYPTETWRYNKLKDFADPVVLHFVDTCRCGNYRLTVTDEDKGVVIRPSQSSEKAPEKLELIVAGVKWPQPQFRDLEELVDHHVSLRMFPFRVASASFRITDWTDWVPITIEYHAGDLTWKMDGNSRRATVRVFGRLTTLTQRIAETFEDEVHLAQGLSDQSGKTYLYLHTMALRSGRYRLNLIVKDVNGDRVGTWERGIIVKGFNEESISSLVLSKSAGDPVFDAVSNAEQFVPTDTVHLYGEVYGLGIDANSKRSNATVQYEVFDVTNPKGTPRQVLRLEDKTAKQTGEMMRIQKELSPGPWQKGKYDLVIRVKDDVNQHEMCTEQPFAVN